MINPTERYFKELSSYDCQDINGGGFFILAILLVPFVAPVAEIVYDVGKATVNYVVSEYKEAAESGAKRGTVDAYNDYNYYKNR